MKNKKIVVTGGSGMVGKSLQKIMPNAIYLSSKEYDLREKSDIIDMLKEHNPDTIIHLAARVGGIVDNITYPVEYFNDNLLMNTLLLKYSYEFGVNRIVSMLSACIFPDVVNSYPMKEDVIYQGPPTPTNFSYAYAKRCLLVQSETYNKKYNTNYQCLIPCNLYGEHDKYGTNSHFVAALLKKIIDAKKNNKKEINLLGTGIAMRQFMYSDDLAWVIKYCIDNDIYEHLNVATTELLTIKEMTNIILEICDASDFKVNWDPNYPDGQLRRDLTMDKLKELIPQFKITTFREGVKKTYDLIKNKI
jgi:GDP-L-fucose synthase